MEPVRTEDLEALLEYARVRPWDRSMAELAMHLDPVVEALHGRPILDLEAFRLHAQWVKALFADGARESLGYRRRPAIDTPDGWVPHADGASKGRGYGDPHMARAASGGAVHLHERCPACSELIGSGVACVAVGFMEADSQSHHQRRRTVIACRSCGTPAGEFHHVACPNDRCVHGIWAACGHCRYADRGHDDLEARARAIYRRWILRESI